MDEDTLARASISEVPMQVPSIGMPFQSDAKKLATNTEVGLVETEAPSSEGNEVSNKGNSSDRETFEL